MKHASLFSGIGGFDLAAEWMGWENLFHCEWNPFCQTVLKHHFPKSVSYGDITTTDFTIWRGRVDVLTGGFPCQPYSTAGKRLGKEDERHLWPQMLRAIQEIAPRFVVGENVRGLLSWNGGMVFDEVQTDLEASGYEVIPFLLPACGVNAPHRRDRIWFVAHAIGTRVGDNRGSVNNEGRGTCEDWGEGLRQAYGQIGASGIETANTNGSSENPNSNGRTSDIGQSESEVGRFGDIGSGDNERVQADNGEVGVASDTNSFGLEGRMHKKRGERKVSTQYASALHAPLLRQDWRNFPTQSPVCTRDDGFSSGLDFKTVWGETNPRKPYITFSKWRQESIKAAGNAIVPQVALQIFKAIEMLKTNHHR